jgi:hypothetical protein
MNIWISVFLTPSQDGTGRVMELKIKNPKKIYDLLEVL